METAIIVLIITVFVMFIVGFVNKLLPIIDAEDIYTKEHIKLMHIKIEGHQEMICALLDHLNLEVYERRGLSIRKRK